LFKKPISTINWTNNDTLVVSDIHLGTKNSQARKFYDFLSLLLDNPPKRLIIAGDLFELWSTNFKKIGETEYRIIRKIIELSQNGIKVVYIPGNHDRAFKAFKKITLGKIKIRDEYVIRNDNKKYLVIHGDEFDAFTRNHIIISIILDQLYIFLVKVENWLKRLLDINISVANKKNSKNYQKIVKKIRNAAFLYAKGREVDGIIIGHTHWPEVVENKKGIVYVNTGDWLENCCYAVIGMEIKTENF